MKACERKVRVCFFVMMTILVSMPYTTSWGWSTHFFITREALRFLLEEEREIFSGCEGTLIESSVLPDKWRDEGKDLESNHLYYPEKSGGTAPDAIKKWYLELVSDLVQKEFEEACMDAGVMAHYIEDMSMPLHTGEFTYHHTSYERSVNERLSKYRIYDFTISYIEDVKAYVISEAKESNSHYQEILNLYDEGNWEALDELTEKQLNLGVQSVANILHSAFVDAGYSGGEIRLDRKSLIISKMTYYLAVFKMPLLVILVILILFFLLRREKRKEGA